MSQPRIFVDSELKAKQNFVLNAKASRHVLQALRLRINDPLLVFNNTGGEFLAVLTAIDKNNHAIITLGDIITRENESPLQIYLGQGISRGEKMDFTVQKAVELGVTTITPLFTDYCNVKLQGERLEKRLRHWQEVAVSAAEQSGRCRVPQILPAKNLDVWFHNVSGKGLCLLFDPKASNKISSIKENQNKVTILVGPEGGLSDQEIAFAQQSGFIAITLGPRILRTETAALAAISVLQAKWGDV